MFDKMSLAKKLSIGFGLVLVLLSAVGLIAFFSLEKGTEGFTEYRGMARDTNLSGRIQANMLMVRMNVKDFLISSSEKDLQQFNEYFEKTEEFLATAQKEIQNPERAKLIDEIDAHLAEYHESFDKVQELVAKRNDLVNSVLLTAGPKSEKAMTEILVSAKDDGDMIAAYGASQATRSLLLGRLYVEKFLNTNDYQAAERVRKEFADMGQELTVLDRELENPKRRALLAEVITAREAYLVAFEQVVNTIETRNGIITGTLDQIGPEVAAAIEEVKLDIKKAQDTLGPQLQASNNKAVTQIAILSVIAIMLGIGVATIITRTILRQMGGEPTTVVDVAKRVAEGDLALDLPSRGEATTSLYAAIRLMVEKLKEKATLAQQIAKGDLSNDIILASDRDVLGKALQGMVANLNDVLGQVQVAGEQIASGSGQVADSSQSLSQGATEQASSLEEISASLNQLSSQTTSNAENANQANQLSGEVQSAAQKGQTQMKSMVAAMTEINEAGQNISKIIKTIDEIAFQTNLLALNAAVEAARAGQHGKGFAVVAEEVRNLAARSAKAAEETAELIEGSVEKTENGSMIANQTATALESIVGGIGKVTDLVAEIAAASSEQAQGVAQINQGITQIDQVTQQNTASAEESAAAAEELSGQAAGMQEMLQRFKLKAVGHQPKAQLSVVSSSGQNAWGSSQAVAAQPKIAMKAQIALDDDEFGKF